MAKVKPTREVRMMRLGDLVRHPRNPREHDVPAIQASMAEFGYKSMIGLDERTGYIDHGHGRLDALKGLKAAGDPPPEGIVVLDDGEWSVPVEVGWSSRDDKHALGGLLADNVVSDRSKWNDDGLTELRRELGEDGLRGTGLDPLPPPADEPPPGDPPAPPAEPGGSRPGATPVKLVYELVFDTDTEQQEWYGFLRWLRGAPALHGELIGTRLTEFLRTLPPGTWGD